MNRFLPRSRIALSFLFALAASSCGRVPALHRDAAPAGEDGAVSPDAGAPDGLADRSDDALDDATAPDSASPDAAAVADSAPLDLATAPPDARTAVDAVAATDTADASLPREASAPCEGGLCQPPAVPGVVFWLDATEGAELDNLSRVQRWKDRSGRGHDGLSFTFATRPLYDATGANGRPMVTFDRVNGRTLYLEDEASLNWGFEDFTLMIVATTSNTGAARGVFFHRGMILTSNWDGSGRLGLELADDIHVTTARGDYNDGGLRLFTARRIGRHTIELRVNGELSVSQEVRELDVGLVGRGYLGQRSPADALQGGIAEIIALAGPLAPADLRALESYLMRKYTLR